MCMGVFVCLSGSVGVCVPGSVCMCVCDIWSGCHAYRALCIHHGDRIIALEGLFL